MNPKRFSTGTMIALIILLAANAVPAAEVPFLDGRELGAETPTPFGSIVVDIDLDGDNDVIAIALGEPVTTLRVKLFESNGATPPSYALRAISPASTSYTVYVLWPKGLAVAPIDSDNLQDVVSCSLGKVNWHRTAVGAIPTFINRPVYNDTSTPTSSTDFLSVAAADLNGDGRTDLVAANNSDDEIWVWINEGNESDPTTPDWTRLTAATGVAEPSMVLAADMNMDGHVDIVVVDTEGDRLLWLQNDGGVTPVFTTIEISAVEDGIRSIALGDLNADGYPEIFSASSNDSRVAWWANGGGLTPTFTPTDITASLTNAYSIAVHDMDRDGDLDVVAGTASPAFDSGSVLWFDSDGSYPPVFTERAITSGGAVQSVSVGDVDNDGDGDILIADRTDNALYVLENRVCAVGFPDRFVASSEAFGADAVHAADLTGNGVPDIVVASLFSEDRGITWFANDGNTIPILTEAELPLDASGSRAQSVSSGDIDGDGDLDVLAVSEAGNWIRWYENDGSGSPSFTPHDVSLTMFNARDAIAVDLDGDGDMDVIGASSTENKVSWFENNGEIIPTFTEHVVTRTARGAWSVFAGDIDLDGDIDIASASINDGRIVWYANDGSIPPIWAATDVFTPEEEVIPAAIDVIGADLDQDGDIDLVSASVYQDKVAWYENITIMGEQQALPFEERIITQSVDGDPGFAAGASSVFAADIDGDGDTDLVVTAALNNRLAWFESDGLAEPSFFARSISTATEGSRSAVAVDLNGDGLTDIINASAVDNSISTFLSVVNDTCTTFDASCDGSLDAQELAWLGRSFGLIREGESPGDDWWTGIDFDGNGVVDGADLAILGSYGVWGRSVLDCSFTCND